jgi:MFS family permease
LITLASVSGIADALTYFWIRPPESAYQPLDRRTFKPIRLRSFMEPFQDRGFRPFLLFSIVGDFSLNLAGPYFNVYMLNTLGITLGLQTILAQIVPGVATFLFIRRMGRMNDRFGNRPVLLLSCAMVCITPLVWLFVTPGTLFLIALINISGGIFVTTVDLSVMNVAIFSTTAEKRSVYLSARAISTILIGVVPAMLIGGILSDWLTPLLTKSRLPFLFGQSLHSFHILLMLSFVLRVIATVVFARRIKEENARPFGPMLHDLAVDGQMAVRKTRLWAAQFRTFLVHRFRPR